MQISRIIPTHTNFENASCEHEKETLMGSPISGFLAEAAVKTIEKLLSKPCLFCVDDTFAWVEAYEHFVNPNHVFFLNDYKYILWIYSIAELFLFSAVQLCDCTIFIVPDM